MKVFPEPVSKAAIMLSGGESCKIRNQVHKVVFHPDEHA